MEKKVALVLAMILLVSAVLVSSQEEPQTIGQRIDSAATDATDFFNKHVGPAVDSVKSVFNWIDEKARQWGL